MVLWCYIHIYKLCETHQKTHYKKMQFKKILNQYNKGNNSQEDQCEWDTISAHM